MRLGLTVALVMVAFAGNSILNRIGVATYGMDPLTFAALRVAAGALVLLALTHRQGRPDLRDRRRWAGAVALAAYMIGFSWAYLSLGAGLGALILFATVQIVMFGAALRSGQRIPALRWAGMMVAMAGLVVLLWPAGVVRVDPAGALAMIAAGIGWGAYTLLGRQVTDATRATAVNFTLCLPLVLGAVALHADLGPLPAGGVGVALLAGAVTSGLGYALWYRVVPALPVTVAAIAQLSVPVIAVVAGILLLSEPVTLRILLAILLVLGGIALSVVGQRRIGSSGS